MNGSTLRVEIDKTGMHSIDYYYELFSQHDLRPVRHDIHWMTLRGKYIRATTLNFHFEHEWEALAALIIL